MMEQKSEWHTKKLAETFLEGVRGAIPGADLQLAVIGKITDLWCAAPKHILDLGCGDGILGYFLLNRFPSARGLFLNFSGTDTGDVGGECVIRGHYAATSKIGCSRSPASRYGQGNRTKEHHYVPALEGGRSRNLDACCVGWRSGN